MPGLGTSFGRGGATVWVPDLVNADCILIEGSNFAEAHPVAFRFVMQAKERGATIIHVDPRFTRTSAVADIYAPIRSGTDIAFLGGIINYILSNERYFKEYVVSVHQRVEHRRRSVRRHRRPRRPLLRLRSEARTYDTETWAFEKDEHGHVKRDETLRTRAACSTSCAGITRATRPRWSSAFAASPPETFLRIAQTLAKNSGRERTTAFAYAVGWTQHTAGVQFIRTAAMLQLLLGNIGRPGGGIMALRGHANIQGATDIPTLYDLLPGYLPMPSAHRDEQTLRHT